MVMRLVPRMYLLCVCCTYIHKRVLTVCHSVRMLYVHCALCSVCVCVCVCVCVFPVVVIQFHVFEKCGCHEILPHVPYLSSGRLYVFYDFF